MMYDYTKMSVVIEMTDGSKSVIIFPRKETVSSYNTQIHETLWLFAKFSWKLNQMAFPNSLQSVGQSEQYIAISV